ncbi:MAG TPA: hypothetical protein VHK86_01925, partial [Nitrososphaera sp.]|nr:hypothetical protein [Nitrososphaera sp.]
NALIVLDDQTADNSYAGSFNDVCGGESLYVAVGADREIQTSPNGYVWTHRLGSAATPDLMAVCNSGSGSVYVAVGESGNIYTSPTGAVWTSRTAGSGYADTFRDVMYSEVASLYIAVGDTGCIQTSPDGITWTARTPDDSFAGDFLKIAESDDIIVIVGTSGELQTSTDGIAWTHQESGGAGTIDRLAYGSGIFVQTYGYSDDGITWTAHALSSVGPDSSGTPAVLIYDSLAKVFICATGGWGLNGYAAVSYDGKNFDYVANHGFIANAIAAGNYGQPYVMVGAAAAINSTLPRVGV